MHSQPQLLTYLRTERRSYLLGSILVLVIVLAALYAIVLMNFPPGALKSMLQPGANQAAMMSRIRQLTQTVMQQHMGAILLLSFAGALATLVLNLRMSMLLNRPRGAFGPDARPAQRWPWLSLLIVGAVSFSLIPFVGLVLEIVFIVLLTRWANQEIRARQQPSGPGPAPATS